MCTNERERRRWSRRRVVAAVVVAVAVHGASAARTTAAPTTLSTGFMDNRAFGGTELSLWLGRAAEVGAAVTRVNVGWDRVAPTAPPADRATDPAWEGYAFGAADAEITAAVAAGLRPILNVSRAPVWSEDGVRPRGAGLGSWKPDVGAFGRFMTAVARRYSGTFTDPVTGQPLPRVTSFQIWNEPNLDTYLAPQWEGGKPFAPVRFRELVNTGYRAIKAVQPKATVAAAGLAPFGDYRTTSGKRMPPVAFLRSMLCLDSKLRRSCRDRTSVDAIAHHPYAVRKPSSPALNVDDATIPDLGKITKVVDAARRVKTVGPRKPKLWVTEVSYDSAPPDPRGVPTARLSRWTAELLWRLWDQGADTVIWYLLQDDPPEPNYAATYQSGMYLVGGARKPSAQAFRFPLVVTGKSGDRLRVWWRTPAAGRVSLQVRRGGRWVTVRRSTAKASGVGRATIPAGRTRAVRAVLGRESSYVWTGSPAPAVRR